MKEAPDVPHSRDNAVRFFSNYVNTPSTRGKRVIDLSAGSGYIVNLFHDAGAVVTLYDLFPDQNKFCRVPCQHIDLQKEFPVPAGEADIVILAETIEHLPNQYFFFKEASRVLKRGGSLLLTTPNSSSLRSRLSQFLMESEHYSTPAPNETNAFTRWPGKQEGYFSKLFISGILRLRTLAALAGLSIQQVHATKGSSTSYWLLVFYPLIWFFSKRNLSRQLKEDRSNEKVFREIYALNTSVNVLTSKHMIIEFRKKD
jgi:SAM-dependent methyltransferase